MNDPLIWARAVQFAAAMAVAGAALFRVFVAEPSFRAADHGRIAALVRFQLAAIAWLGLILVVISGVAWLILLAEQMSELPMSTVISEGFVWGVLSDTGFGHDWLARLVLVGVLAATLLWVQATALSRLALAAAATAASALVGSLAWAGHAAATPAAEGYTHLTADILHLIAASAWVGALVPLALLLRLAGSDPAEVGVAVAREATLRFSTLGVVSVSTLFVTGIVNSWMLVGSLRALFNTDYGRLLLVKIVLFVMMLSVAAVNRLWFTPRLLQKQDTTATRQALRQIKRNSLIEASVGALIIVIVALLGTMPPGLPEQAVN